MSERKLDLVLWGATGFTGRLVAEELTTHAPVGLRWALAGRDREKLERIRDESAPSAELIVSDATDQASIDRWVRGARVVISTVGPYARYGTPLVEACVRHGTDYCDITAETPWIRGLIDRLHDPARNSGARIVHGCGFDSIPSDLGVWLLHDQLSREHGSRLGRARLYVKKARGGFSGGTVTSLLDLLEQASRDRDLRRLLADPYALNPAGEREGPDGPDQRGARFDEELGRWTTPFLMAAINTRVVRRTNALLDYPYGREFRYAETMLASGRLQAGLIAAFLGGLMIGGSLAPTRGLLRKMLPSPGEGPSREKREAGFFEIRVRGQAASDDRRQVEAIVAGDRDPGYAMTAVMLACSALCLACDEPPTGGGILTPASAMAAPLVSRLRAAGMKLEIA